jgi:hypothetical protein
MEGNHKTGGSTIVQHPPELYPTSNMIYNTNSETQSQSSSYPIEESAGYN